MHSESEPEGSEMLHRTRVTTSTITPRRSQVTLRVRAGRSYFYYSEASLALMQYRTDP